METLIVGLIGIALATITLDIVVTFIVKLIAPDWFDSRWSWGNVQ